MNHIRWTENEPYWKHKHRYLQCNTIFTRTDVGNHRARINQSLKKGKKNQKQPNQQSLRSNMRSLTIYIQGQFLKG